MDRNIEQLKKVTAYVKGIISFPHMESMSFGKESLIVYVINALEKLTCNKDLEYSTELDNITTMIKNNSKKIYPVDTLSEIEKITEAVSSDVLAVAWSIIHYCYQNDLPFPVVTTLKDTDEVLVVLRWVIQSITCIIDTKGSIQLIDFVRPGQMPNEFLYDIKDSYAALLMVKALILYKKDKC